MLSPSRTYHPFGSTSYEMHTNDSEVSLKRYQYVGKERDGESGPYYYGARYYADWLCRFVSVDPLKDDYPYLTVYNYAGNKPITHFDIEGMQGTGNTPVGEQRVLETFPEFNSPISFDVPQSRPLEEPVEIKPKEIDPSTLQIPISEIQIPDLPVYADYEEPIENEPKPSFWGKLGNFAREHIVDNIPVIGPLVGAIESFAQGDLLGGFISLGELALDVILLLTTGGIGNIAKAGLKSTAKIIAKETLKNQAARQVSEGREEQGVPVWAQITLGVTLGLKQGRKNITNNRSLKTLPSHKKIKIDKEHILSGHKTGGSRVSMNKDLFPSYMTEKQVIGDIKFAYRSVKKS